MKKFVVAGLVFFVLAVVFASCKSSSKCAAYGETKKFQREVRY